MTEDNIKRLAALIEMRPHEKMIYLGTLQQEIERHLDRVSPFDLQDWTEAAGLIEDPSWLTPFIGHLMDPELEWAVRAAFVQEIHKLQAMGRISPY